MKTNRDRWIATVDARRARMFRCSPTREHGWRLEEADVALRNPWEDAHERGRPNYMSKGPQAGPHHAAEGRQEEEGQRRFARDVAVWLGDHLKRFEQPQLACFGPARIIGDIRDSMPQQSRPQVQFYDLELSKLRPAQLAEHPAVTAALIEEQAGGTRALGKRGEAIGP